MSETIDGSGRFPVMSKRRAAKHKIFVTRSKHSMNCMISKDV